jgi:hypothetical protein
MSKQAAVSGGPAPSHHSSISNLSPWPTLRKHSHLEVRARFLGSKIISNERVVALQLANEQRSLYGLRYHDHERYRCAYRLYNLCHRSAFPSHSFSKHCANRTHRLRSTLKVTHGRGREFKKPPVVPQDKIQDGQFVVCDYIRPSLLLNSYC